MTKLSTILKCEYFPLCSGCERQGEVTTPPIFAELKEFFHRIDSSLDFQLTVKDVIHWRCRSKLAVRGTSSHPEIGLFKRGSHDVVSIPHCPLHHPSINRAYAKVIQSVTQCKIDPYREENGSGTLRYLQFAVERKTSRVQLVLVVNRLGWDPCLRDFVKLLYNKDDFHSLWLNFQPQQTNRILGEEWMLCEGEPYLWDTLGLASCAFHPACFGQAHLALFEEVLKRIREWVLPVQKIVELYAGVGVIGLNLLPQSDEVTCIEINPFAAQCFELSCSKLPVGLQRKISLRISSSEESISLIDGKDVIIVDPPRKGLDAKVLEAICEAKNASQLIYLSCGPRSFQRDCEKLLSKGWKIDRAEGFLFFPGTDHIEVLCSFKK